MKNEINITTLMAVLTRLTNLCEGFDFNNKSVLIGSKLKILYYINVSKNISPSVLKNKVGLAKGNLAKLCKSLIEEGLIVQKKDEFDARVVFYNITKKGNEELNECLNKIKFNIESELAYKDCFKELNLELEKISTLLD